MRKPLHNRYLGPALVLALWFALAEPLACIGYYHGRVAILALAPASTHHRGSECAEWANTDPFCALSASVVQTVIAQAGAAPSWQSNASRGALPASPICFRASGGSSHDAGAPPSPVHELLAEGSSQLNSIGSPHMLARAPQPCRPGAGSPPPTPPPRYLAATYSDALLRQPR